MNSGWLISKITKPLIIEVKFREAKLNKLYEIKEINVKVNAKTCRSFLIKALLRKINGTK